MKLTATIDRRFSIQDARNKLRRLYPGCFRLDQILGSVVKLAKWW